MTDGKYETPRAMSMAVKAAAKASSQDTGQALLDYYHDRFLARVFCEKDSQFVLKGGRGMLRAWSMSGERGIRISFTRAHVGA